MWQNVAKKRLRKFVVKVRCGGGNRVVAGCGAAKHAKSGGPEED